MLFRYLQFLLKSTDEHSVHSPFVFDLYTQVIKPSPAYYIFEDIERIRKQMLRSGQYLNVHDLGAGSKVAPSKKRKVASVARFSEKNARFGQLLFRLINYFQPQTVFDLGTSLGVTTLYQAAPNRKSTVYTFEGCDETLALAKQNFSKLGFKHILPVEGNIDHTLPATLKTVTSLDFVFFDANHRLAPTIYYFTLCLQKVHEHSVFVFDDIYWSEEMMEAWKQIKEHPAVMLTIDLFFVGLVFFRKNQPKQHFMLRF